MEIGSLKYHMLQSSRLATAQKRLKVVIRWPAFMASIQERRHIDVRNY